MEERKKRGDPQRMGDVVNRLMARRGYAQVLSQTDLEAAFAAVIGSEFVQSVRVGVVKRAILEVSVSNSLVLQELTFRKSEIVEALRHTLHGHAIKDIRFRVAPVA